MNDKTESASEQQRRVRIYGAGVAGLTAAHELIERGFLVTVIEPEPDSARAQDCAVGGLARTQWSRAPRLDDPRQRLEPAELEASQPIPQVLGAERSPHRFNASDRDIEFGPGSCVLADLFVQHVAELVELIPKADQDERGRFAAVEVVHVLGTWADDDASDTLDVVQGPDKARRVVDILSKREVETCTSPLERWRRALASERCRQVIEALQGELERVCPGRFDYQQGRNYLGVSQKSGQLVARFKCTVVGDVFAQDRTKSPAGRRCVRLVLEQTKLPGEHGYRFFPAFYSHVFDTMKRIPITEPEPRELLDYRRDVEQWIQTGGTERRKVAPRMFEDAPQGRTVKDNLIPLASHTITGPGGAAFKMTRTPSRSVRGVLQMLRDFQQAMNLTYRDIARMQVKMLQYLMSCPARRDEYAKMTWLAYLGGPYSAGFKEAMITWPRALVGLQADKADARTFGDVAVQLVLDQLRSDTYRDGTLNGPTSVAWLEHWRRYLQDQGVRFERGRLLDLRLTPEGKVQALEMSYGHNGGGYSVWPAQNAHYYVLAVSPVEARQLSVSLREQARTLGAQVPSLWAEFGASDFLATCTMLDVDGHVFEPKDLGDERLGGVLQHYSGIQYFLDQDHSLFAGHAYYPDAPWALSSISQVQFRMDPPDPKDGYRGVVSVDVGSWNTLGLCQRSAWRSSGKQLAEEVWQQICASMGVGEPGDERRPSTPRWYHIDEGILRAGAEHGLSVALGLANLPPNDTDAIAKGDKGAILRAKYRQQAEDSPILAIDRAAAELRAKAKPGMPYFNRTPYLVSLAGAWARSPGRPGDYRLTYGVVMAGTHMRTHTRLATMEAANESARHAVNAILADYRQRVSKGERERTDIRVGEPCETWPLVDRELEDLTFLKKVDAALLRQGLPHMFEILEVEQIVDELVPRGEGVEGAREGQVDVVDKIVGVLEQLGAAKPSSAGAFMLAPLQALLASLRLRR